MNYCDLNEYEDYIENIEFFLKEKCLQICIINSELKNRKKIYIKDIEEIYWEKYFFDQTKVRPNGKILLHKNRFAFIPKLPQYDNRTENTRN